MGQAEKGAKTPSAFLIEQKQRNEFFDMPLKHYHDAYEIYYLLSGERYYFIKEKTYHIIPGDLVLIPPDCLHKTTTASRASHERILINFSPGHLDGLVNPINDTNLFACFETGINVIRFSIQHRRILEEVFRKIIWESNNPSKDSTLYQKVLLIELLITVGRFLNQGPVQPYPLANESFEKIYTIIRYINQHYHEDLSLSQIAAGFYISQFHLSRTFRKVTGFSFTEYINSIRSKEAQRLLRDTKYSVTDIADMVGFASITHFGRVFKSITGVTPLQYRKEKRG